MINKLVVVKEINKTTKGSIKLLRLLKKKITTIFIGDIFSIENKFGYLWGKNKKIEELTEDEKKYRNLWNELRVEILDRGNKIFRSIEQEINIYEIKFLGYRITMTKEKGN